MPEGIARQDNPPPGSILFIPGSWQDARRIPLGVWEIYKKIFGPPILEVVIPLGAEASQTEQSPGTFPGTFYRISREFRLISPYLFSTAMLTEMKKPL